ncbi:MAG: SUMF1/EgtB/PvdO family nonheme iron enzyme [Anaerolineae bacterium]|jgi:serine/threonine-protein kinase|nr:SUMF1/EgtB/PvdO family nonheme iron enzyme [Anaerolineae bacterium]
MPSAPSAGETWTRPADGMVMVYVPAGEFLMGATDADSEAGEDEKPPHRVYLDGFWIDRTEVTNAQYRKCVEARACREPWCWDESNFGYHDRFNALDQPVVCVLWNNAHDYAAWVGGRLPTEAEWEKAARGTDGRKYPWGNEAPDCSKANYKDCVGGTTAVGSCPEGASPYGALDMAGNAWEWTTDKYGEDYYTHSPSHNPQGPDSGGFRVMRGGAFLGDPRNIRCTARYRGSPKYRPWWYGFRVVVPYTAPGP